jgi:hypothetical protein
MNDFCCPDGHTEDFCCKHHSCCDGTLDCSETCDADGKAGPSGLITCDDGKCAASLSDCEPCDMNDFCCLDPEDFCCDFPRCCEDEDECNDNAWEAAFDLFDYYYDDDHDHDYNDFDYFDGFDDIGVILCT